MNPLQSARVALRALARQQAPQRAHDARHHHRRRRGHRDGRRRRGRPGARGRADPEPRLEPHHRALGQHDAGGVRGGQGTRLTITEEDAAAIARDLPAVQASAPSMRGSAQVVFGNLNWATSIQGVDAGLLRGARVERRERPLLHAGGRGGRHARWCCSGRPTPQNLFGDADPIGQIVAHQEGPLHRHRRARPQGPELVGPGPGRRGHHPAHAPRRRRCSG